MEINTLELNIEKGTLVINGEKVKEEVIVSTTVFGEHFQSKIFNSEGIKSHGKKFPSLIVKWED